MNDKKQLKLDQVRLAQCHSESGMSNCVKHSVGCIITDKEGKMISSGYNGTPKDHENCCDRFPDFHEQFELLSLSESPRDKEKLESLILEHRQWSLENEIHAEVNAIMHSDPEKRKGGTLYVNLQPCPNCAKMISASGVSRVIYAIAYHRADNAVSQRLFNKSKMEYKQIEI
jgi:dCMP deaminase